MNVVPSNVCCNYIVEDAVGLLSSSVSSFFPVKDNVLGAFVKSSVVYLCQRQVDVGVSSQLALAPQQLRELQVGIKVVVGLKFPIV
jgi:hypothetical protein